MKRLKFTEMELSDEMLRAVEAMGFEEASPIQSATIPVMLEGKDLIGKAQTGTGKTAAFAIPIIERLDDSSTSIQAIVMCPTRELVIQVSDEFRKLMKFREGIAVVPVYGGQEIDRQFRALRKNPQIIIGTPGRTIDHIKRGTIKLEDVKYLVLDEADEMLDMGFREDIELILKEIPGDHQTVMFSATIPEDIIKLQNKYQSKPVLIDVTQHKMDAPKIEQYYFELREHTKPEALARLIDLYNINLALVFCNTRNKVDELVEVLKARGYFADGLHGDMNQKQRDKIMQGFRSGSVEILVATDVAGRGIDVSDVEAVFNYDLPGDDEDYIHRIGRTGRAGKKGIAFSFIVGKQIYSLRRIERNNEIKVKRGLIPSMTDLEESRLEKLKETLGGIIEEGHLSKYINYIDRLMDQDFVALDLAAALLKLHYDTQKEGYDASMKFDDLSHFEKENDRYQQQGRGRKGRSPQSRDDRSYGSGARKTKSRDTGDYSAPKSRKSADRGGIDKVVAEGYSRAWQERYFDNEAEKPAKRTKKAVPQEWQSSDDWATVRAPKATASKKPKESRARKDEPAKKAPSKSAKPSDGQDMPRRKKTAKAEVSDYNRKEVKTDNALVRFGMERNKAKKVVKKAVKAKGKKKK